MICRSAGNFGKLHQAFPPYQNGTFVFLRISIITDRRVQTDMRCAYSSIILYGIKKDNQFLHRIAGNN
jgi:hypothetical protein